MKNNRRDFLKLTGLTGIGLTGAGMFPALSIEPGIKSEQAPQPQAPSQFVPLNRFPRWCMSIL